MNIIGLRLGFENVALECWVSFEENVWRFPER